MPSEKVLEAKKAKVEQLTETLKNAVSFVIVDYKGITVEEDTKLRRDLRAENVHFCVLLLKMQESKVLTTFLKEQLLLLFQTRIRQLLQEF